MLQSWFWNSNVTNQNNQASLSSKMYDGRLHISPAERLHVDTADSLKMRACIGVPRWQQRKRSGLTPTSICTCRANQHSDLVLTGSAATGWGCREVTGGGSGGVDNKIMKWMPCRGTMPAMSESKLPFFRLWACTNRDHCALRQFAQGIWFDASLQLNDVSLWSFWIHNWYWTVWQQDCKLCRALARCFSNCITTVWTRLLQVQSRATIFRENHVMGMSILGMWLKTSLHLWRVRNSHQTTWREQFSRSTLEASFRKDALRINSGLVCTPCRGFVKFKDLV